VLVRVNDGLEFVVLVFVLLLAYSDVQLQPIQLLPGLYQPELDLLVFEHLPEAVEALVL